MPKEINTVYCKNGVVRMVDQTLLPGKWMEREFTSHEDVATAIETMVVRGAPAIGVAAGYGVALGARELVNETPEGFRAGMDKVLERLLVTRPTAVNLSWAIERMRNVLRANNGLSNADMAAVLMDEAQRMREEDIAINKSIGAYGDAVIKDGMNILTHCNAGALATAGWGTAVGVLRTAHRKGKKLHVWVDETRPRLQGAKLNSLELSMEGIDFTIICDSMAGHVMQQGWVDLVLTGADRIASNGDAANKIGTYSLAVMAKYHGIPFYIAAPLSTIDFSAGSIADIVIEERDEEEVLCLIKGIKLIGDVKVYNPAFDVTPNELITGIITEKGIASPPYSETLASWRG